MRVIAKNSVAWRGHHMLMLLVVLGIMLSVTAAHATEAFPTSENPAKGKWTKMKASSFKGDALSAFEQCIRAAKVSDKDRLTEEQCQKLIPLIKGGKCPVLKVPDGVVFDYMNGRESGRSRVTRNVEKALGRSDRALICDLGDLTFAYWFTGEKGKSCENVGIVFMAPSTNPPSAILLPPPKASPAPAVPLSVVPAPAGPSGRMVCYRPQFSNPVDSGASQWLNGVQVESCCCGDGVSVPSFSFNMQSSIQSSGSADEQCEWVPN